MTRRALMVGLGEMIKPTNADRLNNVLIAGINELIWY